MQNVIVLTIGWTGSSVLTGLLARAGLWSGDATMKKIDYNTWENLELTELNKRLLIESGCPIDYTQEFSWQAIAHVTAAADRIDTTPYREFAALMGRHKPWIWKDPRLWVTIRFWQRLMSLDDVRFVWLTRDDMQSWISANMRRQIVTLDYLRRYNREVNHSIDAFLALDHLPYTRLSFEDIVERPEATLDQLNGFLGTQLTMDDLRAIYTKPLRKRARGLRDFLVASAIHAKNYAVRIDGARREPTPST
jgi:hypothetical protein